MVSSSDPIENRILSALPDHEYERVRPHLEREPWTSGRHLYDAGETIDHVYFVGKGMASLVSFTDSGNSIEVGVIGAEGMLGVSTILGSRRMPQSAVVQLPGHALRMPIRALAEELRLPGKLSGLLLRHMYLLHFQVSRSVLCNRFHHVAPRLCRWLLMSRDRLDSDDIPLTQEFLSTMLGVARPIVSKSARDLQNAGLIDYSHGHIVVLDTEGLKAAACECYDAMNEESASFAG